jgi:hypothetical protein
MRLLEIWRDWMRAARLGEERIRALDDQVRALSIERARALFNDLVIAGDVLKTCPPRPEDAREDMNALSPINCELLQRYGVIVTRNGSLQINGAAYSVGKLKGLLFLGFEWQDDAVVTRAGEDPVWAVSPEDPPMGPPDVPQPSLYHFILSHVAAASKDQPAWLLSGDTGPAA